MKTSFLSLLLLTVTWHTDAHGYYEANFKQGGIKYRADYHKNGDWIETETSIKKKELPKAIRKVIKERFAHLEITEVEKVQSASKGLFYDVEFNKLLNRFVFL